MSVPKVLVTGCAGYIGSVLVHHLLKARCKVVGVDNLTYKNGHALLGFLGDPNFEFHKLDVQDEHKLAKVTHDCDVVIPLAALVGAPLCDKDEHMQRWAQSINSLSVQNLILRLSSQQRVLYPNTNSGYGQTDGTRMVTEEDPLTPISTYGVTKCEGEQYVLQHPNSVVLRLATVFGASPRMRMDLMVNDFTNRLRQHQIRESQILSFVPRNVVAMTIYEPHFKRNFVGVQDVARAFLHFILKPNYTGVYNLGLPTANLTKMELAHAVCDELGLSRETVQVGDGTDPDQRNYLVSNDKILSTGFQFQHELAAGIREVAWVSDTHSPEQLAKMRNI